MPEITGTPYKIITDSTRDYIRSFELSNMTEEEGDDLLFSYLRKAIIRFRACKQNLNNKDEKLKQFNIVLTDEEIEILALLTYIEYFTANVIAVPELLHSMLPTKDVQYFSPANHLNSLRGLKSEYKSQVEQLISVYSYSNSSLFNNKLGIEQIETEEG